MHQAIEAHRPEIERLCRTYGVVRLAVFGSALRSDFVNETSDIDLLVRFRSTDPAALVDAYFGLKESLESLLGRPVDLITEQSLKNPYLREQIERSHAELYAA